MSSKNLAIPISSSVTAVTTHANGKPDKLEDVVSWLLVERDLATNKIRNGMLDVDRNGVLGPARDLSFKKLYDKHLARLRAMFDDCTPREIDCYNMTVIGLHDFSHKIIKNI